MTDENTIREDSDGVRDFVETMGEKIQSRRSFMGDAAKVGAGAVALGAVGTGTAAAQGGNSGNGGSDVSDLDVLNYALTLEHLEATYYREFLNEYSEHDLERSEVAKYFARPTLRYSLYQQIEDVAGHEKQHVDVLTKTIKSLGGTPVEEAEYEFPYDSLDGFITLADRLESVGVSAYAGAAPLISNPDLIPPALSIHSVEANHWTFFNFLNLRRAAPNAFNPARTMDEVLGIAGPLIKSGSKPKTATVSFSDQTSDGTSVTVDSAYLPDGGYVAMHDSSLLSGDALGSVIGVSEYFGPGAQMGVNVDLYQGVKGANYSQSSLNGDQTLIAMPHKETNGNETYDFDATKGKQDGPYTKDGSAVIDKAQITVN